MSKPRILVFAHKPPPHHGQSQMVQFLVDGLSDGSKGIEIYHVNAQLSSGAEDIGRMRPGKLLRLLGFVLQALKARFFGGYTEFYYIPAPAKPSAIYRDWMVLGLCRWAFPHLILHWHSVGLGQWLKGSARPWQRCLTRWALGRASLSLSLSQLTSDDAAVLHPKKSFVVPNGIPDPVPKDEQVLLSTRHQRQIRLQEALRRNGGDPVTISVLFLALCSRDKGVIDALNSVILANARLQQRGCPCRFHLTVAGEFVQPDDRAEFDRINAEHAAATVHGFLDREKKNAQFLASDLFLFPTYYANEGQPLNLVEAMAWGLPIVTTRWRAIPEILPVDYPGIVAPRDIDGLASQMLALFDQNLSPKLRNRYRERFTVDRHLDVLAEALRSSRD